MMGIKKQDRKLCIILIICLMILASGIITICLYSASQGINGTVQSGGVGAIALIAGMLIRKFMEKK